MSQKKIDWKKNAIKFDVWAIVSELVSKTPGLLIERNAFLRNALGGTLTPEQLDDVMQRGDYDSISVDEIDAVANKLISKTRLKTSGASFLTGLPSSLPAIPATIAIDVSQSFAFYIFTAQELAYLYGETRDFTEMDDEDVVTTLLLYLGAMFGIRAAGRVLVLVSKNAGEMLAKKFGTVAVTKVLGGIPWRVAKAIAGLIGIKLTKEVAAKGIAKVLPILGGVVSGAITYATFGPMAARLQEVLREAFTASDEDVADIFEELSVVDEDALILNMSEDVIEGVISDIDELGPAPEPCPG